MSTESGGNPEWAVRWHNGTVTICANQDDAEEQVAVGDGVVLHQSVRREAMSRFTARPEYTGETMTSVVVYADEVPVRTYFVGDDTYSDVSGDHMQAVMRGWAQDRAALADAHRAFRETMAFREHKTAEIPTITEAPIDS
jgi:hypothetical protein